MTKETEKISSRHQTDVLNQLCPGGIMVNHLEMINEKLKDAVNFTTWNRRTDRELRIDGLISKVNDGD